MRIDDARILMQLKALRRGDPSFKLFGANEHRYQLNPVLSESEIRQFEASHSVALPKEYRTFLLKCGNGGAGPYYGVFPLGFFDGAGGPLESWTEGDGFAGVLSRSFPHNNAWNLPVERFTPPDIFRCAEEEDIWHQTLDADKWKPSLVDGAFPIAHQGCAIRNYLVVSGDERGNVWVDDRANDNGIYPETMNSSSRVTFLEWYLSWLDEALAKVQSPH